MMMMIGVRGVTLSPLFSALPLDDARVLRRGIMNGFL